MHKYVFLEVWILDMGLTPASLQDSLLCMCTASLTPACMTGQPSIIAIMQTHFTLLAIMRVT